CIPCSLDRWYVPLGRQNKKTNNWSSQVYTMFSGLVRSAQRHYNRQDSDYMANQKREGHERNT
uniref:Uncharacterized protein n=1 Tax=Triticum urartu TaxID=4572 RepID=A0A8R7R181_TRIUA